jgi:hypothetical protein
MDLSNMNMAEYQESGEFSPICITLHDAGEILHTADRIPDETTKAPLIEGAKKMVQNVLDALNGRRTEGLVEPEEDD